MLTAEGCKLRRERLWKALPSACDVLVISDPAHLVYLANFVPSPFEFRTTEWNAALVLTPDRAALVSDDMLGPFNAKAHVDEVVAPTWYDGMHSAPHRRNNVLQALLATIDRSKPKSLGLELGSVPAGVLAGREVNAIIDLDPIIRPLRRSKDADELAVLKRSMRAGEAAQAAALAGVRPGMTELDVYLLVQNAAAKEVGEGVIVYGDFASGPRCATDKGGPPTSRVIEAGDLLLLDFSVIVDGYRGDFTNTFVVAGEPSAKQREFFEACVGAIKAGEAVLKPGALCRDVDAAVRGSLKPLKLDHLFTSHSGHGLGLGHPEPPYFVPESDGVLQVGDVVALEPGLYLEGVGGMRFERNYLITPNGFETLSNHKIQINQ